MNKQDPAFLTPDNEPKTTSSLYWLSDHVYSPSPCPTDDLLTSRVEFCLILILRLHPKENMECVLHMFAQCTCSIFPHELSCFPSLFITMYVIPVPMIIKTYSNLSWLRQMWACLLSPCLDASGLNLLLAAYLMSHWLVLLNVGHTNLGSVTIWNKQVVLTNSCNINSIEKKCSRK